MWRVGAALVAVTAIAFAVADAPAHADVVPFNPFDVSGGFTIVAQGDASLGNGELEGSIASFGTITSGAGNYPVVHQAAGMADYTVPTVDGDPVRILAGAFGGGGGFDVSNQDNSGTITVDSPEQNAIVKLVDTTGLNVVTRGGGVGLNNTGNFARLEMTPDSEYIDVKAAPFDGTTSSDLETDLASVADYFPDLDAQVQETNECLTAMYDDAELANRVTVNVESGLTYLSDFATDRPNYIDYTDVPDQPFKMDDADGYTPTAQAPLVIRVPAGTTEIGPINFEGWSSAAGADQDFARHIMLDMSEVTGEVTIDGFEMGAIWAPEADLNYASGITTNGQWFAGDVTAAGGGEIHHHSFGGQLLCDDDTPVTTTAPTTAAPTTTAPTTAAPTTAAPDTTAPDTTAPDTTAPDTTAPDTTSPGTNAPVTAPTTSSTTTTPTGILPATGGDAATALVALVLIAVGGGLVVLARGRPPETN